MVVWGRVWRGKVGSEVRLGQVRRGRVWCGRVRKLSNER